MARAAVSRSADDACSSAQPIRCAVAAETGSPPVMSSTAGASPMRRGRRTVPPQPGNIPIFTSGQPIDVVGLSATTRRSHQLASSTPPPRQTPSMAATVTKGSRARREEFVSATAGGRDLGGGGRFDAPRSSCRSAPARNEPGFPERRTSPARSVRPARASSCPSSSSSTARESTLTLRCGSAIVKTAMSGSGNASSKAGVEAIQRFSRDDGRGVFLPGGVRINERQHATVPPASGVAPLRPGEPADRSQIRITGPLPW